MRMTAVRIRHVAAGLALAVALSGCVVTTRPYYYGGVVTVAPPPPRVEVVGVAPVPGYVWIGGYWRWAGAHHEWVPGRWVAPRPGYHWVAHGWVREGGGWRFHEGHWAR